MAACLVAPVLIGATTGAAVLPRLSPFEPRPAAAAWAVSVAAVPGTGFRPQAGLTAGARAVEAALGALPRAGEALGAAGPIALGRENHSYGRLRLPESGSGTEDSASPDSGAGRSGARAWPVESAAGMARPIVVRGWEPPPSPYASGHRGVDLDAWTGTTVRAAAAGRVSFAGLVAGRRVMAIELDGTGTPPLRITYEPVRARVGKGDRVVAGQPVGTLDSGPFHCPAGCLHWGLRRGDRYFNPLSLLPAWMLRGGPSRLLPVFGVPEGAPEPAGPPGMAAGAALRVSRARPAGP